MDRKEALQKIKPHLTKRRYAHTLGVMHTAIQLAKRFCADEKKSELAAIFHDYAKERDPAEMKTVVQEQLQCKDILQYDDELLHAPCGAYYVKKEIGITDEDILNAIRYHTTGRPQMSLLEKIIFLADYIEPNRSFPQVDEVRKIAETSLDGAIIQLLKNTIIFLTKRNELIYPKTIATYNAFIKNEKEQ